jgi:hypothetical protein
MRKIRKARYNIDMTNKQRWKPPLAMFIYKCAWSHIYGYDDIHTCDVRICRVTTKRRALHLLHAAEVLSHSKNTKKREFIFEKKERETCSMLASLVSQTQETSIHAHTYHVIHKIAPLVRQMKKRPSIYTHAIFTHKIAPKSTYIFSIYGKRKKETIFSQHGAKRSDVQHLHHQQQKYMYHAIDTHRFIDIHPVARKERSLDTYMQSFCCTRA